MSNFMRETTGGANIKPGPRASIHNHIGCRFAEGENMVRYGAPKNIEEYNGFDMEELGEDVVDNIISKPANPIGSPSHHGQRRKSLDASNNKYNITDYGNDVLSKSVPATLPSQLYSSNISDDDQDLRNESYNSEITNSSYRTPNRSNINRSGSIAPTPNNVNAQLSKRAQTTSPKAAVSFLGVVAALCAVFFSNSFNVGQVSNLITYNEKNFYVDISNLGEKYKVDSNSILQVQTGISTIFEKQDTGSFIFVYNSNAKKFNHKRFNMFINEMSLAASKYLRNESSPRHYTVVEGANLDIEEHGDLICKYRDQLSSTGVMLVRNLEAIPSNHAMDFHYFCDEYNPLVKKSAIFFTINLNDCPSQSDTKSLHAVIEKCLNEKWKGVPADSILPLLARVVAIVIDVTSVF